MITDSSLPKDRSAARARYVIERLTDPAAIRGLLAEERAYAAYALGQLSPELFAASEWWLARSDGAQAIVVHSRGGLGRAMFIVGDAEAAGAALGLHPGPRFTFASFRMEHKPAVRRYFHLVRDQLMLRMAVTRESFRPAQGEAIRLRGRDVQRINRLYSREGGSTSYTSRHIEDGVYFGVLAQGKLVSIAGTHVASPAEGMAVVGNVFTHPDYRGAGLATIATSAVTEHLLQECPLVVLTVETTNREAVHLYERLGYAPDSTLIETPVIRKEPLGVMSWGRRLLASWRGRRGGSEVVVR